MVESTVTCNGPSEFYMVRLVNLNGFLMGSTFPSLFKSLKLALNSVIPSGMQYCSSFPILPAVRCTIMVPVVGVSLGPEFSSPQKILAPLSSM